MIDREVVQKKLFLQTFGWPLPACRQAGFETKMLSADSVLVLQAQTEGLQAAMAARSGEKRRG